MSATTNTGNPNQTVASDPPGSPASSRASKSSPSAHGAPPRRPATTSGIICTIFCPTAHTRVDQLIPRSQRRPMALFHRAVLTPTKELLRHWAPRQTGGPRRAPGWTSSARTGSTTQRVVSAWKCLPGRRRRRVRRGDQVAARSAHLPGRAPRRRRATPSSVRWSTGAGHPVGSTTDCATPGSW